jgi:hypothetical protein
MDNPPKNNSVLINLRDGIVSIQSSTESFDKCVKTADLIAKQLRVTEDGQFAIGRAIQ